MDCFNLLDGLNGLCSGIGIIAATIFFMVSYNTSQVTVCILLLSFIGAQAGFFIFNFPKGKIFLGSSGSMFIGYTLSVLVLLQSYGSQFGAGNPLPLVMPVLILSLPLVDTLTVMYLRFRQHRPMFAADHNHIHHRLRKLRMKDKETTLIVLVLTFAIGINATLLYKSTMVESIIILVQAITIYLVFAMLITVRERRTNRRMHAFGIVYAEEIDSEHKHILEGFILNISHSGCSMCLINAETPFSDQGYFKGKNITLKMLPSGQSYHGATPFLQLTGMGVWTNKVAANAIQVGVEFNAPLIDERNLIESMFYLKEVRGDIVEELR
jgi:hypothetical protein